MRAPASLTPAKPLNFTTPYTLGQYLLMDYMSRKTEDDPLVTRLLARIPASGRSALLT